MDLRIMAMKRYLTFIRAPELEPHHQMQFTIIPRTTLFLERMVLTPLQGMQSANSKPSQESSKIIKENSRQNNNNNYKKND